MVLFKDVRMLELLQSYRTGREPGKVPGKVEDAAGTKTRTNRTTKGNVRRAIILQGCLYCLSNNLMYSIRQSVLTYYIVVGAR